MWYRPFPSFILDFSMKPYILELLLSLSRHTWFRVRLIFWRWIGRLVSLSVSNLSDKRKEIWVIIFPPQTQIVSQLGHIKDWRGDMIKSLVWLYIWVILQSSLPLINLIIYLSLCLNLLSAFKNYFRKHRKNMLLSLHKTTTINSVMSIKFKKRKKKDTKNLP